MTAEPAASPRSPSAPAFFDYSIRLRDPVRPDFAEAHRRAWARLAAAGSWWTGADRVAMAAASRTAVGCGFCRDRRQALSPNSIAGQHDATGAEGLPPAALDAVHRIVSDATRLTKSWIDALAKEGVSDAHYVELLSVVVAVRSIDSFHRALGLELEPLPEALPGEPSRRLPEGLVSGEAFVRMLPGRNVPAEYADLFPGPMVPYVVRAMSLVPDAVRWLKELSSAHYLDMDKGEMMDFSRGARPLSRAQTELIAGRVSALNECFY